MLNVEVPLPMPLLRPVMTIHPALLLTDHAQPAATLTEIDSEPDPPGPAATLGGVTVAAHGTCAWACVSCAILTV